MITEQVAKDILEVFGPCTALYECNTADDIRIAVGSRTIADYLQIELSMEYNFIEGQFAAIDPESKVWDELAAERQQMTQDIIQRAKAKFGIELKDPGKFER